MLWRSLLRGCRSRQSLGEGKMGHGSLGGEPRGMIGVFMINFLLIVWLGSLSGKRSVTQVILYSVSFGRGKLEREGRNSWLRSQPNSQRQAYKAQKKRSLFADQQILYPVAPLQSVQNRTFHMHPPTLSCGCWINTSTKSQRSKQAGAFIYFNRPCNI